MVSPGIASAVIERAKRGDEEAFRLIFNRFGRPIHSFIDQLAGNRELAEELTQETFVRAFRRLSGMRSNSHLSTWLFGIARNVVREAGRDGRRRGLEISLDEPESQRVESKETRPEGALLDLELTAKVRQALASLDDDKKVVFVLRVFHDKSYDEIGTITGFSTSKIKTDLHRARTEVRRQLDNYLNRGPEAAAQERLG